LVTTTTLHGPSKDAAYADGAALTTPTAKTVANAMERRKKLIMGTLVLASWRRRPIDGVGCGRCAFSSSSAKRPLDSKLGGGMVSRRRAGKEGVFPAGLAAEMGG